MKEEVLRISSLCKSLEGIRILENFNLNLYKGEILGILGLSDAGKTTLMKILAGQERYDQGSIYFNETKLAGNKVQVKNRIAFVQKQSSLVDNLTVADNVLILRKHFHRIFFVRRKLIEEQVKRHFEELKLNIPCNIKAEALQGNTRLIVEIVKGYILGAQIILIDDFAQKYTLGERLHLLDVIENLRQRGVSFILTSQQIEPLTACTDRILLLSNKRAVKVIENTGDPIDASKLFMAGTLKTREISTADKTSDEVVFSVHGLSGEKLRDVSFAIHQGEVVLIVDPLKNSIDELYGVLQDQARTRKTDMDVAFTDFNMSGEIVNYMSVRDNLCLSSFNRLFKHGVISDKTIRYIAREFSSWHGDSSLAEKERCLNLSKVEKIAIYLYRLYLQKTAVLFCMDPAMVTDYSTTQMVKKYLKSIADKGVGICIFTPTPARLEDIADRIMFMQDGYLTSNQPYFDKFSPDEM